MPLYEFKNKETGEVSEIVLGLSEYDQYLKDNPNLERYFSRGLDLISDSKSPMTRAGKDWEDHLSRIKKGSGRDNNIKV